MTSIISFWLIKMILKVKKKNDDKGIDLEIHHAISPNELIYGLNNSLNLGINMDNPEECFLRMENPIGLIRGETILREYRIRNGSILYSGLQG